MKFSQLVEKLGAAAATHSLQSQSALDPEITGVSAVAEAAPQTLSFVENDRFVGQISQTQAAALILPNQPELQAQAAEQGMAWISTDQPRLLFAQAIRLFYQPFSPAPGIDPTAVIHPSAQLGEQVSIGAHVVIQADVKVGNAVCIHPNVVVYPEVQIGDRAVLHANCVIHERAQIGADCVVHSGAVIGAEGFGFVPAAQGWFKMAQSGYTVLEDGVEVGCNSTIDRPLVGQTRIGRGTKIDNQVQIGHGCQIGENCALASQVGLAGGAQLGNWVILAGQVGVADKARIGDRVIASAQTGIPNDIPAGLVVSGAPAMPNKIWLRTVAVYRRLPEIYQILKQLQRQLESPE